MNAFMQDIAFAWRNAVRSPITSLLIVVTLALGIGANSAMFSISYHVLLAPLPFPDGERLMRLQQHGMAEGIADNWWSVPTFNDVRDQSNAFSRFVEFESLTYTLLGAGEPYLASTGVVNWEYFQALGIEPLLGRTFLDSDEAEGAEPVMLLSSTMWRNRFAENPDIIGASLEMNNIVYTVVGIMPQQTYYPHQTDIWVTTANDFIRSNPNTVNNRRGGWMSYVFATLKSGVSLEAGERDINTIARRLALAYPDTYSGDFSITLSAVKDEMVGESAVTFVLLLILAVLVVLIASANIASLNLARLATRQQELAIRAALGANPARMTRQLLTESICFALVGGTLGLAVAAFSLNLLQQLVSGYTALAPEIKLDGAILLFALALSIVTGFLSSSVSIFRRIDINRALKEGGDKVTASTTGVRKRQGLLIVQFALSMVVLTTAALIAASLLRLNAQDTGYDSNQVLALSTEVNYANITIGEEFHGEFSLRLLEETRALTGVDGAAIQAGNPLLQGDFYNFQPNALKIEGRAESSPGESPRAMVNLASEGFFSLMKIELLQGRFFNQSDGYESNKVAIVNESFADKMFPGGDAIGQRISYLQGSDWATIVGVVSNIRSAGLNQLEGDTLYFNYRQSPSSVINLYVKSAGNLQRIGEEIRRLVLSIDPRQSVGTIKSLNVVKAEWLSSQRLVAALIGLFGMLALVVTLSGVVGVVSYHISCRIREVGIRLAVGANPGNIRNLFLKNGLLTYFAGLGAGLLLMLAIAPLLEPLLFDTSAGDPGLYALSVLILTLAVTGAMYFPASRASRLDPARAFKVE